MSQNQLVDVFLSKNGLIVSDVLFNTTKHYVDSSYYSKDGHKLTYESLPVGELIPKEEALIISITLHNSKRKERIKWTKGEDGKWFRKQLPLPQSL